MDIKNINIPLAAVAGIVIFTASSVFTIETRYATAANVSESFIEVQKGFRQERILNSITDDRMWLELLEIKLEGTTGDERSKLLRQIRLIEIQIDNNMGRIE